MIIRFAISTFIEESIGSYPACPFRDGTRHQLSLVVMAAGVEKARREVWVDVGRNLTPARAHPELVASRGVDIDVNT